MSIERIRKSLVWLSLLVVGFLMLVGGQTAHAEDFTTNPTPTQQYVVDDYAHILSPQTKQMVINKEKEYQKTYARPQVVMMTVPNTHGESIDDYADDLLANQRWHFGNKQFNNGVLLLYSEQGQHVRISTGYGVEDILPDAKTHEFLTTNEDMLKSMNPEEINEGLQDTFQSITGVLDKRYAHMSKAQLQEMKHKRKVHKIIKDVFWGVIILFLALILFWPHNHDKHDHWHEDDDHLLWDCLFWDLMFGSNPGDTGFMNTPTDSGSGVGDSGGSFGGFSSIGGGGSFGGGGSSI